MNYLQVINIEENEIWDNIVKSFKNYDVNYLNGYAKAFQLHGDGEPMLFYFNEANTRAMKVVMKRDIALLHPFTNKIPLNTFFDLSTPYGYGGLWVEGENYDLVNKAFDSYCSEMGFISEFTRFHLFTNHLVTFNGISETHTHNIVRNLEPPLDEMLMDFEHKVRKNIKKAVNAGLEIEIDSKGETLDDFLKIYYGTMNRTNASDDFYFSKAFFEQINKMTDNYVYLHVLNEKNIISSELVLYGTENCYSFLGGTNQDYFHLRPNDFLKFEIIKWAKSKGLKNFILGGGYGEDDGIYRYKKSLAPNGVIDFYIGKKIYDQVNYDKLVEIRRQESDFNENATFFPLYRA